jgi:hypothetical protein
MTDGIWVFASALALLPIIFFFFFFVIPYYLHLCHTISAFTFIQLQPSAIAWGMLAAKLPVTGFVVQNYLVPGTF